jgi:hypothetical protein
MMLVLERAFQNGVVHAISRPIAKVMPIRLNTMQLVKLLKKLIMSVHWEVLNNQ